MKHTPSLKYIILVLLLFEFLFNRLHENRKNPQTL
jgi:hypothetical protein